MPSRQTAQACQSSQHGKLCSRAMQSSVNKKTACTDYRCNTRAARAVRVYKHRCTSPGLSQEDNTQTIMHGTHTKKL